MHVSQHLSLLAAGGLALSLVPLAPSSTPDPTEAASFRREPVLLHERVQESDGLLPDDLWSVQVYNDGHVAWSVTLDPFDPSSGIGTQTPAVRFAQADPDDVRALLRQLVAAGFLQQEDEPGLATGPGEGSATLTLLVPEGPTPHTFSIAANPFSASYRSYVRPIEVFVLDLFQP